MLPHYTNKREQVLENTGPTITVLANVMMNPQGKLTGKGISRNA